MAGRDSKICVAEIERLISIFYLTVAARTVLYLDPYLTYTGSVVWTLSNQ